MNFIILYQLFIFAREGLIPNPPPPRMFATILRERWWEWEAGRRLWFSRSRDKETIRCRERARSRNQLGRDGVVGRIERSDFRFTPVVLTGLFSRVYQPFNNAHALTSFGNVWKNTTKSKGGPNSRIYLYGIWSVHE